jgi:hypothetical protein
VLCAVPYSTVGYSLPLSRTIFEREPLEAGDDPISEETLFIAG